MFRQDRILIAACCCQCPRRTGATENAAARGGAGMDYREYDAATLERGKAAFVANCGFCHGANAKGRKRPDLVRSWS